MTELVHILTPASAAEPAGAVVLLHGRGADERELARLLGVLDRDHRLVHVTPAGPLASEDGGRHWYASGQAHAPDPETFAAAYAQLDAFLAGLPERTGVPWARTVIGGFSQGAVMASALALGGAWRALPARPAPAGLLMMSGYLPGVPGFDLALDGRAGFPVCLTHGALDAVIDVEYGRTARATLDAAGADVAYHESAMGHVIDPRILPDVQRWLLARS